MKNLLGARLVPGLALCLSLVTPQVAVAQLAIWTSAEELIGVPMSGPAWELMVGAADSLEPAAATVSNKDSRNNVEALAAAIVFARSGDVTYQDKVVTTLETLISQGFPEGRTLEWARETGAYVMAADLVGYRTADFEAWCRNIAEVWVASDGRTLLEMFKRRPNNWGAMAFGSLTALYVYLGDLDRLNEVRDYWVHLAAGPLPDEVSFGSDLSWHFDESNPRVINPMGATKDGLDIGGVIPDDMRRGGSFSTVPLYTGYPWGHLQGLVTAARVLDRAGLSIWGVEDNAIFRAAECLQVRYEQEFGGWAAQGDDEWLLPYLDAAYGTDWASAYDPGTSRIWDHGKIAGWGYVVLGSGPPPPPPPSTVPEDPSDLRVDDVSSSTIDLAWVDNSNDEACFQVERSDDGGLVYMAIACVSANSTAFADSGLQASFEYCYRVRAHNSAGYSNYSNVICATTQPPGPNDALCNGESTLAGTRTGTYLDTHVEDDTHEAIEESESDGKPNRRYSYLEHKWMFSVSGGSLVTFHLQAHKSPYDEGDDFVFSYSVDDQEYFDMLTISSTVDNDVDLVYQLPEWVSGTLYVRVVDSDRTSGRTSLDSVYIDQMFVRSETGKPTAPSAPSNLNPTALSASEIALDWRDNSSDELGFVVERSNDGGQSYVQVAKHPANTTGHLDVGLDPVTEYCYRVYAYSEIGLSGYSNEVCTTTFDVAPANRVATGEIVSAGTVIGDYSHTQKNDGIEQLVQEVESGGKPANRTSLLEHTWTFAVTSGSAYMFQIQSHRSDTLEGDDFIFSYSTDGLNYQEMLRVTKTVDDDTYQEFDLGLVTSDVVYVRVMDADRTPGRRSLDTIHVDHMLLERVSMAGKQSMIPVGDNSVSTASAFDLLQNHPNPFNPMTEIGFKLSEASPIVLRVFNVKGEEVVILAKARFNAGTHRVLWDGKDGFGKSSPSGVYYYRLETARSSLIKRMILIR